MDDEARLLRKLEFLASPAAVKKTATRQYAGARPSRLTSDWRPTSSSADFEISSSLRALRARARQLVRDSSYAKRAAVLVVNNVIGSGIGLQCQIKNSRGEMNKPANADVEEAFEYWGRASSCHTGGRISFKQFERICMAQIFEAGEVFIREHYSKFGDSEVPYALELIESERVADDLSHVQVQNTNNEVRLGVEVDRFQRPVAYYVRLRAATDIRYGAEPDKYERVPADQIIHLAVIDRWPQTRGVPWLHAAARRLNDMDGYSEAEIVRARVQAASVGAIETSEDSAAFGEEQADGTFEMEVEPGVYKRLAPGEKLNALSPTAPNPALDPFMRYMLREVASGISVSYASLSSDYSQSNYSSSRLALLDDRDLWKFLQVWFVSEFRQRVHRHWLQQAILSQAVTRIPVGGYAAAPKVYEKAKFKPRGWSWIDPTSEVEAYKEAVKAGFMTVADVVAMTNGGQDLEDVLEGRANELKDMEAVDLVFDTSPDYYMADAEAKLKTAENSGQPAPAPAAAPPARALSIARPQ